jgi:hypothetical protein
MWGNPMRERERYYYSASGKYKTTTNTHFERRKILHNTKIVPLNSASIFVPNLYGCTTCFVPRFPCQHSVVGTIPYSQKITNKSLKSTSKIVSKTASIFVPNPYCCTDCTDPYSTKSHNIKITQPKNIKYFLGICTLAPLENMPSLLLTFLSQAYSENLSQSSLNVSCTLPNAFFYKYENDLFPPKCLFTFPNPKSKGQD